jgi:hypothetical protein
MQHDENCETACLLDIESNHLEDTLASTARGIIIANASILPSFADCIFLRMFQPTSLPRLQRLNNKAVPEDATQISLSSQRYYKRAM